MRDRERTIRSLGVVGIGCALLVGLPAAPAAAYTPESPIVLQMVERGVQFIETAHQNPEKYPEGDPLGAKLLTAYTHHKVRQDVNHPIVREGLETAVALARSASSGGLPNRAKVTYEASVAILLMIDAGPQKYASEIQGLADALMAAQKPHGGFGYLSEQEGDTSQTQYVVLAMWTLDQADFEVPSEAMDAAVRYLLRTQDPSGRWGYKGQDSGMVGRLVRQDSRQSHSLTTAGIGSVLIGADFFQLWGSTRQVESDVEGLPPALKEKVDRQELQSRRSGFEIPPAGVMQFVGRTESWLQANPYRRPSGISWYYYYLYALERYKSFLEVAQGKQESEPAWYNQVVDELRGYQSPEGGWGVGTDRSHSSAAVSTSFAVLFLIRSTKRAIGDLNEGILAGGYGLPKDTTNVRVEGTQIKGQPVAEAVTDLLSLLEDEDADSLETGSIPENLQLDEDPAERRRQLSRLERLARGSRSYQARRVATRLLGQSDELDVVPALIFGLTDPDPVVRRYARDGLRFISRRFEGFGLPDDPTPQEVRAAVAAWRQWYTDLNPGYVFLD